MSIVYKYLPAERVTYFEDSLLRFSPPGALNDPYECLPALPKELLQKAFDHFKAGLYKVPSSTAGLNREERRNAERMHRILVNDKLKELKVDPDFLMKKFYDHSHEKINSGLGILSLSRRWDSSLMWSHYSDSHAGFCIGFDYSHSFFQKSSTTGNDIFFCDSVVYSTERSNVPDGRPNKIDALKILLTKAKDWSYEEEERAIALLSSANKTIDSQPFKISLFEVPHDAVCEVIVGLRSSVNTKKIVIESARKLNVPVFITKISELSFDVERVAL